MVNHVGGDRTPGASGGPRRSSPHAVSDRASRWRPDGQRSRKPVVALVLLAVLAAACGSAATGAAGPVATQVTAGTGSATPGAAGSASMSKDDALLTYGYAPSPSPSVKFQPDVVIVGGGSASVRWASDDGHTWAIDPTASGASDLKVGSVMFLTSRAVGRVAELSDQGGSRIVALAPVQLGELFSSADFHLDQAVDLGSMNYQALPVLPGSVSDPSASPSASPGASGGLSDASGRLGPSDWGPATTENVVTAPTIRLVAARRRPAGGSGVQGATTATQLPPVVKSCAEVTLAQAWSIKPCVEEQKISLGIDYKTGSGGVQGGGLKFGGVVSMRFDHPHMTGDMNIQGGSVSDATVLLEGVKGVDVSLDAGAADGAKDDKKFKFEVPVEVEVPIPPSPATLGIPLNVVLEFKAIVEVAFAGKNGTLSAVGSYQLDGPIGVQAGMAAAPAVTVTKSLADSIKGLVLAPSGLVLAGKFKFHVGLGMDGFIAGPYAVTTVSVGISLGSALGSPIGTCAGATIDMWVGGGVGATIDFTQFKTFLPDVLTKFKNEVEKTWNVYTVTTTIPDVPVCKT